jgi:hypothetical protein
MASADRFRELDIWKGRMGTSGPCSATLLKTRTHHENLSDPIGRTSPTCAEDLVGPLHRHRLHAPVVVVLTKPEAIPEGSGKRASGIPR